MAAAGSPMAKRRWSSTLALKEGFLQKKGGIIKSWSRRFFILNKQSLVYFKREQDLTNGQLKEDLQPLGRIFLSDIVTIVTDGIEKKRSFVFALHTKKRAVLLQAASNEDRQGWVETIRRALESEGEAERKDPFRKTLRRLRPGLKRITLVKDPDKGIGCTIKNAAGHILVNRILEDGPIAITGVLRPGDEILDIHGASVTGLTIKEVAEVIKNVPYEFLATVRPITALKRKADPDTSRTLYSTIVPQTPTSSHDNDDHPAFAINDPASTPSCDELEDCGNYDDEDDGDTPPPLPPRTEDALIIVDPPPSKPPPMLPPRPTPLMAVRRECITQRSTEGLTRHPVAEGFTRHPMMDKKSLSQGDSVDEVDCTYDQLQPRPPIRRQHLYETIDKINPNKLIYVDVDLSHRTEV